MWQVSGIIFMLVGISALMKMKNLKISEEDDEIKSYYYLIAYFFIFLGIMQFTLSLYL